MRDMKTNRKNRFMAKVKRSLMAGVLAGLLILPAGNMAYAEQENAAAAETAAPNVQDTANAQEGTASVLQTDTSSTSAGTNADTPSPRLDSKKLTLISGVQQHLVLENAVSKVKWKSDKKSVVTVTKTAQNNEVILTAKKAGKATITATVGKKTYKCKVKVVYQPSLSKASAKIKEGKVYTLKVKGTMERPVWSSSDPETVTLVRVSAREYQIRGLKPGNAVISASVGGKVLTCSVKVKAAGSSADVGLGDNYTGWQDVGSTRFYWQSGKRVKGWQQIGSYTYFFTTKGMYRNCVAGTAASGYHYVDAYGRKVNDPIMEMAVSYLRQNATAALTPKEQLYRCFRNMSDEHVFTYRWHPDSPWNNASVMRSYAYDTFTTRIGNCWRFGAAMAYVAKALGFEARVAIGGVTAHSVQEQSWLDNHGWCEVLDGGVWKMIDISMQMHHPEAYLFMLPRANYPYRWRCDYIYDLHVSADSVYWS